MSRLLVTRQLLSDPGTIPGPAHQLVPIAHPVDEALIPPRAEPESGNRPATTAMTTVEFQLDAALLFDEVRELATIEERHRLARGIHDGIAQELVSVSYALDNALGETQLDVMAAQVAVARHELRRILSELRLSIFDLRSDVRPSVSLATALSSYVHSIERDPGLTIHVRASTSQGRLPAECESELLSIAQEALTNARKHAAASNIWVTLTVQAPDACLRIEDDGTGFANASSATSFGLDIMSERATRIGAMFDVLPRPGHGTIVQVVLGDPLPAATEFPAMIAAQA
ncbi:MAG: putative signal transduction histidine kinase [Frankiales bacterium]|nr:putative signal transduction histidine kinase [Frankiales bacterium]